MILKAKKLIMRRKCLTPPEVFREQIFHWIVVIFTHLSIATQLSNLTCLIKGNSDSLSIITIQLRNKYLLLGTNQIREFCYWYYYSIKRIITPTQRYAYIYILGVTSAVSKSASILLKLKATCSGNVFPFSLRKVFLNNFKQWSDSKQCQHERLLKTIFETLKKGRTTSIPWEITLQTIYTEFFNSPDPFLASFFQVKVMMSPTLTRNTFYCLCQDELTDPVKTIKWFFPNFLTSRDLDQFAFL